jgi:predicted nucleic acid-binding Zn ribbon protein
VRKVFGPVGIIFKGSGFHTTDYRKPEKKGAGEPKKQPTGTTSPKREDSD